MASMPMGTRISHRASFHKQAGECDCSLMLLYSMSGDGRFGVVAVTAAVVDVVEAVEIRIKVADDVAVGVNSVVGNFDGVGIDGWVDVVAICTAGEGCIVTVAV